MSAEERKETSAPKAPRRKKRQRSEGWSDTKEEGGKCWTAHILTEGNSDSVDVYLPVTQTEAKDLESLDWTDFQWEGDCCGQNRCAVCSGALSGARLIGIIKHKFPFPIIGDIKNTVWNLLREEIGKRKTPKS